MKHLWIIFLFSVILLVILAGNARATVNTLTLVDVVEASGSKTCIYSDGRRTETVEITSASSCPSKKTFH